MRASAILLRRRFLPRWAGMRHRAGASRRHRLAVAPDRAGLILRGARLPRRLALRQLFVRQLDLDQAPVGVDLDDVAVLQEADRAADGRLGRDVADAEAARRAGETAIGDQGHLLSHALTVDRGG